jgi:hypothetical protein
MDIPADAPRLSALAHDVAAGHIAHDFSGMEYLTGALLALGVGGLAAVIGFSRERSFYPTVTIVIASYYVLFAAMDGGPSLQAESAAAGGFLLIALAGFRLNLWWVVAALIAHGTFDFLHSRVIDNPGVPPWWPGFCLSADVVLAGFLAIRLLRNPHVARAGGGERR